MLHQTLSVWLNRRAAATTSSHLYPIRSPPHSLAHSFAVPNLMSHYHIPHYPLTWSYLVTLSHTSRRGRARLLEVLREWIRLYFRAHHWRLSFFISFAIEGIDLQGTTRYYLLHYIWFALVLFEQQSWHDFIPSLHHLFFTRPSYKRHFNEIKWHQ